MLFMKYIGDRDWTETVTFFYWMCMKGIEEETDDETIFNGK